jgi:hypothetical protein
LTVRHSLLAIELLNAPPAIRKIIAANPNVALALIIEPDSLPNLVTNSNLTTCQQSADGYRQGVAYALQQLNLPNVVMYLDAGHGGWLGELSSCTLDFKGLTHKCFRMGRQSQYATSRQPSIYSLKKQS